MDSTTTSRQCNTLNHSTPSRYGIFAIEKAAKDYGVDIRWALYCRIQYIRTLLNDMESEIEELLGDDGNFDPAHLAIMNNIAAGKLDEMIELTKQMKACERRMKDIDKKRDGITDDMIAQARAYPIDQLIAFQRGAALAWCHDDKRPSLTHDRKRNRAKCWPCDKSFDSIAVLMDRDGMSFVDAVRALQ